LRGGRGVCHPSTKYIITRLAEKSSTFLENLNNVRKVLKR